MSDDARRSPGRWAGRLSAALLIAGIAGAVSLIFGIAPGMPGTDPGRAAELGRSYLDRGLPLEALRVVADVRASGADAGEAMTVAGQAFLQLDRRRDARAALGRALELDPRQALAAKLLAAIHIASNDTKAGIDYLLLAARIDPGDARPWAAMGRVHFTRMEYDRAVECFEHALNLDPADREAVAGLIEALLDSERPEPAGPLAAEALRRFPDDPGILALAARQAVDTGRAREAIDLADLALGIDPDDEDALTARATAFLSLDRLDDALVDAERAAAIAPLDIGALSLLTQARARLGLTDLAAESASRRDSARKNRKLLADLASVIAERPEDVELHWRMGRLAADCGLPVLASQSYRSALELDPRCREALEGLAALRRESAGASTDRQERALPRGQGP